MFTWGQQESTALPFFFHLAHPSLILKATEREEQTWNHQLTQSWNTLLRILKKHLYLQIICHDSHAKTNNKYSRILVKNILQKKKNKNKIKSMVRELFVYQSACRL